MMTNTGLKKLVEIAPKTILPFFTFYMLGSGGGAGLVKSPQIITKHTKASEPQGRGQH